MAMSLCCCFGCEAIYCFAYLSHVGPARAADVVRKIVDELIDRRGEANVSRIDLCVDFASLENMEWSRHAWITRATYVDSYSENGVFTGWVVGKGGIISARLSYMAREGITDLYQGQESMMAAMYLHVADKAQRLGLSFDAYIDQKLGIKGRLFNTILNNPGLNDVLDAQERERQAREYRKASKGGT